jgi:hypothetical protein
MAQNSKSTSEYSLTPINNWYLDIWVPVTVNVSSSDTIITIPPSMNQRPDLLSFQEYGTPDLWWLFAVRNPDILIDPINDFVTGLQIYIPPNIVRL